MSHMKLRLAAMLLALVLTAVLNSASFAQGAVYSHHLGAWFRNDDPAVMNAQNYSMYIYPASPLPTTYSSIAASYGWLGAWIGSGQQYFLQVGFMEDAAGLRYFVYSDHTTMYCWGPWWFSYWQGHGCLSDVGYWGIQLDQFQLVQLDTDLNGTWNAFVYNPQGRGVQVAQIYFGTNTAFWVHAVGEEAYNVQPDPVIMMRYYFYHPMYYQYPSGWTDWPCSDPNNPNRQCNNAMTNYFACETGTPDIYKAITAINGDPYVWFTGWGGNTCYVNPLF